jgi:hypothetical protein
VNKKSYATSRKKEVTKINGKERCQSTHKVRDREGRARTRKITQSASIIKNRKKNWCKESNQTANRSNHVIIICILDSQKTEVNIFMFKVVQEKQIVKLREK